MKRKKQTVDKMDFIVQKTHWIVSAIIRIGKIPRITQQIRDKHVVVHGGAFAGELLADLLEKDLMNLPVESAENEESPTEIAA